MFAVTILYIIIIYVVNILQILAFLGRVSFGFPTQKDTIKKKRLQKTVLLTVISFRISKVGYLVGKPHKNRQEI